MHGMTANQKTRSELRSEVDDRHVAIGDTSGPHICGQHGLRFGEALLSRIFYTRSVKTLSITGYSDLQSQATTMDSPGPQQQRSVKIGKRKAVHNACENCRASKNKVGTPSAYSLPPSRPQTHSAFDSAVALYRALVVQTLA